MENILREDRHIIQMAYWLPEGQYDLSPQAVEQVSWSGQVGHYHVALQ